MKNIFMDDIKAVIKRWWKIIAIGAIVIIAILLVALLTYYLRVVRGLVWADWTGFGEYTGELSEDKRAKTLWDLLELIIVPAVLGFGALLLNKIIRDNEQRRTTEQQQEQALQHYLDKMSELLIEKNLLEDINSDFSASILVIARGRTVSTLRMLNKERNDILLSFLRDANLADHILKRANLIDVYLWGALLWGFNLEGAMLRRAILTRAFLWNTNLTNAYLGGANLRRANLERAVLVEANLSGANLSRANLSGAELEGANLEGTNLKNAIYDDKTKWPKDFDVEESGASKATTSLD